MLRLRLNEPVLDRIANECCIVRQPQLLEDPPAVGADRARAEKHLRGDLVDMLARRYQPHHPVFAIGEQVVRRLLSALGEIGSQLLREGRAYILTPTDNLADGGAQVFGSATVTLVPSPRTPVISTLPPNGRTRSRTPRSPSDLGLRATSASMPRPLSSTVSTSSLDSDRTATSIRVAPAWRATLVSNS